MHGIVNYGIQKMVTDNFGEDAWRKVLEKSGVEDVFELARPYPDTATVQLAVAAGEVLELPVPEVLKAYGKWWISFAKEDYSGIFQKAGSSFFEFISGLNDHHARMAYMMPGLVPPKFEVTDHENNAFTLNYYSEREGLETFVMGLIEGLGEHFSTSVDIGLLDKSDHGKGGAVFRIKYA